MQTSQMSDDIKSKLFFTKEFFKERLGNISSEEIDFLVRITNEKVMPEIERLKKISKDKNEIIDDCHKQLMEYARWMDEKNIEIKTLKQQVDDYEAALKFYQCHQFDDHASDFKSIQHMDPNVISGIYGYRAGQVLNKYGVKEFRS